MKEEIKNKELENKLKEKKQLRHNQKQKVKKSLSSALRNNLARRKSVEKIDG